MSQIQTKEYTDAIEIVELMSFDNSHLVANNLIKNKPDVAKALYLELFHQLQIKVYDPS